MLAIVGSRLLFALDPASQTMVRRPPLQLPKVTISLIYNEQSEKDPGHTWLRQLVRRVSNELDAALISLLSTIPERRRLAKAARK